MELRARMVVAAGVLYWETVEKNKSTTVLTLPKYYPVGYKHGYTKAAGPHTDQYLFKLITASNNMLLIAKN